MKNTVLVASVVTTALTVAGCSSIPDYDPRSPYYTSVQKHSIAPAMRLVERQSPAQAINSALSTRLWQHFEKWQGTPYKYGGNGRDGIDCSAYVQVTMDEVADIRLPRTTRTQIDYGRSVQESDLQVGDIVFFVTKPGVWHNGIYMGNGQFMHASSSKGVMISKLSNQFWAQRYWQSRRVI